MRGFSQSSSLSLALPAGLVPDMGCGPSKVDDLPLVIHCRERRDFFKDANDYRLSLAAAHVAYFHSLRHVGDAIRRFVDEELVVASSSSPGSPVLTLPSDEFKSSSKKKNKSRDSHVPLPSSSSTSISHSPGDSGDKHAKHDKEMSDGDDSHLHLSSGSESPVSAGHIHVDTPQRAPNPYGYNNYPPPQDYWNYPNANPIPPYPPPQGFWGYPYPPPDTNPTPYVYYMKKSATPSQTFVYKEPEESSGYGYSGYSQYPEGWFPGYPTGSQVYGREQRSPAPGPPPTPPSPPRVSTWDYFNVFDSYDSGGFYPQVRYGYGSSTSSPDSKEVREREGIPDLEDETDPEISRTIHEADKVKMKKNKKIGEETGNVNRNRNHWEGTSRSVPMQKNSTEGSTSTSNYKTPESLKREDVESGHIDIVNSSSSSGGVNSSENSGETIGTKSPDDGYLKKKEVSFEVEEVANMDVESSKPSSLTTLSAHGTRDLEEVVKEIRDEFETASSFGKEVAVLLEVAQLPYQRRETGFRVIFSRILYLIAPNICSHPPPKSPIRISSRTRKMAKEYVEPGQNIDENMESLSSIMDKIYIWEKKLYKEVKDEERLRVLYEKKCKRLRALDSQGAESSKIDATQASIRKLLMKIDVCIRAVEAISSRIHKLRDKELRPRLTELIYGLIRMWKSILRCHQKQFQAIMESKVRSLKANTGFQRESGLKATLELEVELSEWSTHFSDWINYQKAYVSSLNKWLMKCIKQEQEVTSDGIPPFSPGRIGAPPIFVVCNDWDQAMERISGDGVAMAMNRFASSLHQLWERQDEEQNQRTRAQYLSKDYEKRLRNLRLERERRGHEQDAVSDKTALSKVNSDAGVSPLDDLKVDLDSMRKKLEEERLKHKEAIKLVHNAASNSLQAGLIPIFEALGNFSSEILKAHEQVRLQDAAG